MPKLAPLTREGRIALFPATALALAIALILYQAPWHIRIGLFFVVLFFSWVFLFPFIGILLERNSALRNVERWTSMSINRCPSCDYDISATPMRCPECGFLIQSMYEPLSGEPVDVDEAFRPRFQIIARNLGYPREAVNFVWGAYRHACKQKHSTDPAQVDAKDLCNAIRDYAKKYFKTSDRAIEMLIQFKIQTSEDVARIVNGFVSAGLRYRSRNDSPEDFAGIFTLDDLFRCPAS